MGRSRKRREKEVNLSDRLSSRTIKRFNCRRAFGTKIAYPPKGKPVAASDALSRGDRRPRKERQRQATGDAPPAANAAGVHDEPMERPKRRPEPTMPENVMCLHAMPPYQEAPPLQARRGMTTIRPRQVDRIGAARLMCDGLHDGDHEWPPAFQRLSLGASPGDSVDEGEIVVD